MSTLVRFIEKRDDLSLEPLLDLLANFAHDLGVRFESHFGAAVTLVASVAATHPSVEVIEWSFTCLAWLFKYLSRLLVPDLRPLFQIMGPLLGREPQKAHTTRFAAEALSFLLRKAALSYQKDKMPLDSVVAYILEDLGTTNARDETVKLYQYGLMALFVDTMKGIERRVHSCGAQVYRCLLEHTLKSFGLQQDRAVDVVHGITIGLLHLTDAQGFQPLLSTIHDHVESLNPGSRDANIALCGRLIFIASTVRKGSRIANWTPVLNALLSLLSLCDTANDTAFLQICKAAATIFQTAPMETIIPQVRPAMNALAHDRHSQHFLAFCINFHELGSERFKTLLFPYFSK